MPFGDLSVGWTHTFSSSPPVSGSGGGGSGGSGGGMTSWLSNFFKGEEQRRETARPEIINEPKIQRLDAEVVEKLEHIYELIKCSKGV